MSTGTAPIVVVGGGVVGLCCAHALTRRGAEVTVIEAATPGSGASRGNAGWIVPALSAPVPGPGALRIALASIGRGDSPFLLRPHRGTGLLPWLWRFATNCTPARHAAGLHATAALAEDALQGHAGLAADGVNAGLRRTGLLMVGEAGEVEAQRRALLPLRRHGVAVPDDILTPGDLGDVEPALARSADAGLLLPQESIVDPGPLLSGLQHWLEARGVAVHAGSPVTAIETWNGAVRSVRTGAGRHPASAVVLAAGVWTAGLLRSAGVRMRMQGGKGYSFSVSMARAPDHALYLLTPHVGCTPLDGRVRLAGTMELSGINARLDPRRLSAMRRAATPYLRDVDWSTVGEEWAGLRPLTPDGLPVIDRVDGIAGLHVATGHGMLGVTLGPATALHLASLILDRRRPAVLEPFRLDRPGLR